MKYSRVRQISLMDDPLSLSPFVSLSLGLCFVSSYKNNHFDIYFLVFASGVSPWSEEYHKLFFWRSLIERFSGGPSLKEWFSR